MELALVSRSALVISLSFAGLLAASLGLKLALVGQPVTDEAGLIRELRGRFADAGFTTQTEKRPAGIVVHAVRGSCRMMARSGDDAGSMLKALEGSARPYGPLRFGYRGEVTERPHSTRIFFENHVQRQLARIGLRIARPAQIAHAATAGCSGELPDLSRLAARMIL